MFFLCIWQGFFLCRMVVRFWTSIFVVNRTRVQAEQGRGTSTSSLEEALCDRAAFFESVIIIARNREKRDRNNNSILSCSRSSNQTSNLSIM